jgi:peptidyl-prolyl cis-trans isomerase D
MDIFRRILKGRLGAVIGLSFLALIAVAFAAGDITGSGGLNVMGPSAGEVARVGKAQVTVNALQNEVQRAFTTQRREQPELTMAEFLAGGALNNALDRLISQQAVIAYGERKGMRASKALIDAQILQIGAFRDAQGNFSNDIMRQVLQREGLTEKQLREDITYQIMLRHFGAVAAVGAVTPESMARPYGAMLLEQRAGTLIPVPSAQFAPRTPPSERDLAAFYAANGTLFTLPEQRRLRYALVERSRFFAAATPSETEIAADYKANAASYAGTQLRSLAQLVLPSEADAKAMAARISAGTDIATAASTAGLSVNRLAGYDQGKLAGETNAAIAAQVFAARSGAVVGPVRGPLGWTIIRVDGIQEKQGRTLDQARAEISDKLRAAKAAGLFADFINQVEDQLADGAPFTEVAKARGLTLVETPAITAEGRNLKDPAYKPDAAVTAMLKPAFDMAPDDDAQAVTIKPDEQMALVAIADSIAAGPPPLAEARAAAIVAYSLSKGRAQAEQIANRVAQALNKGGDLATALKAAGVPLPQAQPVAARRSDINNRDQPIPPPMRALFSLKQGSARVLPLEQNQGFVVLRVDAIQPGDPAAVPGLLIQTRNGLAQIIGNEYLEQLIKAAQAELGVERNEAAIAAVRKALADSAGGQ